MTVLLLVFVIFSGVILSPSFADQLILCESINGTSNCANTYITCSASDSIYNNDTCTAICFGVRACVNTTLDSNFSSQFNVICNGSESCKNATIKSQDSDTLNLTITAVGDKEIAAEYSKIYCPAKLTVNGEQKFRNCVIYCPGNDYGCDNLIFYARNGFNDMIIIPFDNERLWGALIFCGYAYQFKCNYDSDAAHQDHHFYECDGEGEEKICENYTAPAFTYSPTTTPTIPTVQPAVPTPSPTDDANSHTYPDPDSLKLASIIVGALGGGINILLISYGVCKGNWANYIGVMMSIVGIGDFATDIIFCIALKDGDHNSLFSWAIACLFLTYVGDKLVFFRAVWKIWFEFDTFFRKRYIGNCHDQSWKVIIIFIFGFLNTTPILGWGLTNAHKQELEVYKIVFITCLEDIFQIAIVVVYTSGQSGLTVPSGISLAASCLSVVVRLLIWLCRR